MSLYNLVHGENPMAVLLLAMLGVSSREEIPRYRDCYWNGTEICVYTRTGGGNREEYEDSGTSPNNLNLRMLPGYIRDSDDEYDPTYATFYYKPIHPAFSELLSELPAADATPAQKWKRFLDTLKENPADPQVTRVVSELAPVFEKIIRDALERK